MSITIESKTTLCKSQRKPIQTMNNRENKMLNRQNMRQRDDNTLPPASDIFCWKCHKLNVHVPCSTCRRSFHKQCCSKLTKPYPYESWRCVECVNGDPTKAAQKPKFTKVELKELLALVLDRCNVNMPNAELGDHDIPSYPSPVLAMNLHIISYRLNTNRYATTAAFLSDLIWIEHQLVVSAIYNAPQHGEPPKSDILQLCRNMLSIAESDIREIEQCAYCFHRRIMREPGWFSDVCPTPHTLIWAPKGHRYFPAKAMGVNSAGTQVDVQFFGRHNSAWVPVNKCYLYAEKSPMPSSGNVKRSQYNNDFGRSKKEVKAYIRKYTEIYGKFEFAEQNVLCHFKKPKTTKKRATPRVTQNLNASAESLDMNDEPDMDPAEQDELNANIQCVMMHLTEFCINDDPNRARIEPDDPRMAGLRQRVKAYCSIGKRV